MGFFSDLKEDLSQAVNELMPGEEQLKTREEQTEEEQAQEEQTREEQNKEEQTEEPETEISIDEMLKRIDTIGMQKEAAAEEKESPGQETAESADDSKDAEMEKMLDEMLTAHIAEETQAAAKQEENRGAEKKMEIETARVAVDETSVITAGMTVTGDIVTEGSMEIVGTINGNVDALGKLNITGHVNGNSKAAEIYAEGAKINGEVVSEGAVKIGASSVIIGNISAFSAAIAGAVKGDIDIRGPVVLDASAIVMGNIKSKSVQINNGAVIEGMCSQCYADVSPTSFFDEYKPDIIKKTKNR